MRLRLDTVSLGALQDPAAKPQAPAAQGSKKVGDAAAMAAKLANPTNAVASMTNNFDYKKFQGDLPDSSDQDAYSWSFQPTIPYPLESGKNILFRPNVPLLVQQPVFDIGSLDFDDEHWELGNIGYDLILGETEKSGLVWFIGMSGQFPTRTNDDIDNDAWTLGPTAFLGYEQHWGIFGSLFGHQWDYAGDDDVDVTSGQYLYAIHLPQLGPGWQLAASPTWSYNNEAEDSDDKWTIPLGIGLAKTTKLGDRFWKFQVQYWYYAETPDTFGEDWQIRFTITPVFQVPWAETHH